MRIEKSKIFILVFCILFLSQGCAMMEASRKKREEKLEALSKQKDNYFALLKDLQNKKVGIGTELEIFEKEYGRPQDTFGSSGGVSNFVLWSYEYPDASKDEAYRPIRLYFNDQRLTYWTN